MFNKYSFTAKKVLLRHPQTVVSGRDVKFVFFSNTNFICKIRIVFELCLGPESMGGPELKMAPNGLLIKFPSLS